MSKKLKLVPIGDSTGVILPREILEKLQVERGDQLYLVDTPLGIELTPHAPDFAKQMEAAELVIREDRDVLTKLTE